MEYIDICDSEGNLTGEKKSKKEVHQQGLWHKSVHVWIVNSQKELLIQKRSPEKDNNPNMWDISAAGHVSAGEDCLTSALRETEEEIGLKVKSDDFILIGTVKQESERPGYVNKEINPVYIIKMELDPSEIKMQKEEVSEVKFIPFQEFKKLVEDKDPTILLHPKEFEVLFDFLENKFNL